MSAFRKLTEFFKPLPARAPKQATPEEPPPSTSRSSEAEPAPQSPQPIQSDLVQEEPIREAVETPAQKPTPPTPSSVDAQFERASEPSATQSFNSSSSRRIVKNGETIIRSSDTEDDSDSSLDDLDDLLGAGPVKARKLSEDASPQSDPALTQRRSTRNRGRKTPTSHVPPSSSPEVPQYKFSLSSLVAQAEKQSAAEARLANRRRELGIQSDRKREVDEDGDSEMADSKRSPPVRGALDIAGIDTELLASVVNVDGDNNDDAAWRRLKDAMERTEALKRDDIWRFFETGVEHTLRLQHPEFPDAYKGDEMWTMDMFVSGYIEELANGGYDIPDGIVEWIFDQSMARSYFHYSPSISSEPNRETKYSTNWMMP